MTNQEKFDIEYAKPVDVQECHKALTDFIKRRAILRVPARADDPDMLISRALRQLTDANAKLTKIQRILREPAPFGAISEQLDQIREVVADES